MLKPIIQTLDVDGTTNAVDTAHTVYTCPNNGVFEGQLTACNRDGTTAGDLKIALVPSGETLGNSHYIEFTKSLAAKTSLTLTGIKLREGDKVIILSSVATVNFVLNGEFGAENF